MIIWDQERKGLINSDNVLGFSARPNIGKDDYVIVAILTPDSNVVIGEYNTEQMTDAVMDRLYCAFADGQSVYAMPLEE